MTCHPSFLFRLLFAFLTAGTLCATLLVNDVYGDVYVQGQSNVRTMKRTEQAEAAAVLKALTEGWALVDSHPDVDFLLFVSEDREELALYPKKSFVQLLERSGLIENLDKKGSAVREPYIHYEGDDSVWKEVTEAGSIMFQYRVTPRGEIFLLDAPKLIGKTVRLIVATSPIEIPSKPLKVVTYDRQAVQKLVAGFSREAMKQIEVVFTSEDVGDPSVFSTLLCGPELWRKVESKARLNGLVPRGRLVSRTYAVGKEKTSERRLEDQPLLTSEEVRLFWKTLRESYKIGGPPLIRQANAAESSQYQEHVKIDDFPLPDLSSLAIMFVVEMNNAKFAVLVKSEPTADMKHFGPEISWIDLMQGADNQD